MRSAVVAVGDELLLGDIVNGNAAWLGAELAAVGAPVVHSSMVGDDATRIVTAVRRALEDADVVVVTGGLGPTVDDLTRHAVAEVAGVPLDRQAHLEERLRGQFAAYGYDLPDAALQQADLPRGATALENPVGTAPGLRVELGDRLVFALPGPPHELAAVMSGGVLAEIAARSGQVVLTRTLHCAGLGESAVAGLVDAAVPVPAGVALAYLAAGGIVRVRLTTAAAGAAEADRVLHPLVEAAREVLGDSVFGHDADNLAAVVVRRLAAAGATLAVAESLTAGLLGAAVTEIPGSSAVFRGGVQVYASDLKVSLAGVPEQVLAAHGAVSSPTAAALADGVRARLGATYGLGLTGVAGPDLQEGQPAGTLHVGLSGPAGTTIRSLRVPGDRSRVRLLAVTAALDLLRRALPAESGGG
ncbi:MAG: competence/damage-inducible protein A [Mycobacteriales bacterium]